MVKNWKKTNETHNFLFCACALLFHNTSWKYLKQFEVCSTREKEIIRKSRQKLNVRKNNFLFLIFYIYRGIWGTSGHGALLDRAFFMSSTLQKHLKKLSNTCFNIALYIHFVESSSHLAEYSRHVVESSCHVTESSSHLADSSSHVEESSSHVEKSSSYLVESNSQAVSISHEAESCTHVAESNSHVAVSSIHLVESSRYLVQIQQPPSRI
jgi:hypothetical protein